MRAARTSSAASIPSSPSCRSASPASASSRSSRRATPDGRQRRLLDELARRHPELDEPEELIRAGHVWVDGFPVRNPASLVRRGASIALRHEEPLRGAAKLAAALERFGVPVAGRVAVDLGAAAGGFTKLLLDRGAARVYAVDAGHGQLRGFLRQDARVVNLEGVNLAALDPRLVPEPVELVTVDLSYLALAAALPQLGRIRLAAGAELVALVKPMFELRLARPPADRDRLELALARATHGAIDAGWEVVGQLESPVRGAHGAVEFFIHGRRPSRVRAAPSAS